MKLSKDEERILTNMAFAEKSNKEIAKALGIKVADVHAARSRLGITIPKVKAAKLLADQKVKRTAEEINTEIMKVEKALNEAKKKTDRCIARLETLYEELVDAHVDQN